MGIPSKPIAKNSNNKFTTRNNKQEIFSRITKASKLKVELNKRTKDVSKPTTNKTYEEDISNEELRNETEREYTDYNG